MTPSELKQFHRDLNAALSAGVPLGHPRFESAQLNRWEGLVLPLLPGDQSNSSGLSLETSDASVKAKSFPGLLDSVSGLPSQYTAALQTYASTKSISPVLDGLTVHWNVERELSRMIRGSLFYLGLVLVVAIAGISFYAVRVLPVLNAIRSDPNFDAVNRVSDLFDLTPVLWGAAALIGLLVLFILVWLLLGRAGQIALWLGGKQYLRFNLVSRTLRVFQAMIDSGMPAPEAASVSCSLSQVDAVSRKDIESAIDNKSDGKLAATRVTRIASYFNLLASRRLNYLRVALPTFVVLAIGGVVACLYCLAVFTPIVSLLIELVRAGEAML